MAAAAIEIVDADSPARLALARVLVREYAAGLGVDLCFQDLDAELAGLPGAYAAPAGALLLAFVDGQPAGCGALRSLPGVAYEAACEMKRVFVRPAHRGRGLGRLLAQRLIGRARQAGYRTMLLDTLHELEAARAMYATLGFEDIPPYYRNPIPGVHYLKADLDAAAAR